MFRTMFDIKSTDIIETYNSRRNRVYKLHGSGSYSRDLVVVKQYRNGKAEEKCDYEFEMLDYLYRKGINVPRPIGKTGGVLFMEYIPGILLNDLVESLDTGDWIKELALWLAKYHETDYKGIKLVKGDVNLRNFIFYKGSVYGIDFEEEACGSPIRDVADICFFILTNKPSFTREKDYMIREFLKEYSKLSGMSLEGFSRRILECRTAAKLRRAKNETEI